MSKPKAKLSERRQRFIIAYLETLNASEAARRAGYKSRANVAGQRLLTNADIRAKISQQLDRIIGSEKDTIKAPRISRITGGSVQDAY
jgi:Phage terminase, small subunit